MLVLLLSFIFLECHARTSFLTYNAALLRFVDPTTHDARKLANIGLLVNQDYDVMCLQEIWETKDQDELIAALGPDYIAYREDTDLTGTAPCAPYGESFPALFFSTEFQTCLEGLGEAGATLLGTQFCLQQLDPLLLSQLVVSGCSNCVRKLTVTETAGDFVAAFGACATVPQAENFNNNYGLVLLSKRPLTDFSASVFPLNPVKGFLSAKLDGQQIVCTHLTSSGEAGDQVTEEDQTFGAVALRTNEIASILASFDGDGDDDDDDDRDSVDVLIGDLNCGLGYQNSNIAENGVNFEQLQEAGFTSKYVTKANPGCTWCGLPGQPKTNPAISSDLYNSVIDHVLYRGDCRQTTRRVLDNPNISVSDHYGIAATLDCV